MTVLHFIAWTSPSIETDACSRITTSSSLRARIFLPSVLMVLSLMNFPDKLDKRYLVGVQNCIR